jgi:hypothetical protein
LCTYGLECPNIFPKAHNRWHAPSREPWRRWSTSSEPFIRHIPGLVCLGRQSQTDPGADQRAKKYGRRMKESRAHGKVHTTPLRLWPRARCSIYIDKACHIHEGTNSTAYITPTWAQGYGVDHCSRGRAQLVLDSFGPGGLSLRPQSQTDQRRYLFVMQIVRTAWIRCWSGG